MASLPLILAVSIGLHATNEESVDADVAVRANVETPRKGDLAPPPATPSPFARTGPAAESASPPRRPGRPRVHPEDATPLVPPTIPIDRYSPGEPPPTPIDLPAPKPGWPR